MTLKVIGLLSGTSADGIDAALCEIDGAPPQITARILYAKTYPYPQAQRETYLESIDPQRSSTPTLCQLNFALGESFAQAALMLMQDAQIAPADVDLIGSHGQTVWHSADDHGHIDSTLQIGEPAVIAERTGITTISSFRARDVAAGGQGAPLTAYVDYLLLRHPTRWRAVQNIGGIGNVTFLPPLNVTPTQGHEILAFDTGPGNALIDSAISFMDPAKTYDADGAMARAGSMDEVWLDTLMHHPYYQLTPPKTTGRELFSPALARELVAQGRDAGRSDADIIATITMLTAASIADAYQRYAPAPIDEVIVGGGGRLNPALMQAISGLLHVPVVPHEAVGIDGDFKEALVFAVLAYETWFNRAAALPAQTGARHATVLGSITPGDNYAALLRHTWGQA